MGWEQFGQFLDRHGFPMAVAIALLFHVLVTERREAAVLIQLVAAHTEVQEAIHTMNETLSRLTETLNIISRLRER